MFSRLIAVIGAVVIVLNISAAAHAASTGVRWSCVSASERGYCGPFNFISRYPSASVIQNDWRAGSNDVTALDVNSPGDWQSVLNKTAGLGYPDAQQPVNDVPTSDYTTLISNYSENGNYNKNTVAEAAYDIWLVDPAHTAADRSGENGYWELMIWEDNHGMVPAPGNDRIKKVNIGGVKYWLWVKNASLADGIKNGYIAFVRVSNARSGTLHLVDFLNYLRGAYYPDDVRYSQWDFGWEVHSTGHLPEEFQCKILNWSVKAS
jgi:hypothetical protein